MNMLLEEIISNGRVSDDEGNSYELHSHTRREQCLFLQKLIEETRPLQSLEVGLAYGISTLAILDSLSKSEKPFHHIVIDPFQDSWKDIGLTNIERAGFMENVTFHRECSDRIVPKLYYDNFKVQFVYIDSTKIFDVLLMDVYFITKILEIGGLLVLDDCGTPGIRKLCRFINQHPSYEIHQSYNRDSTSKKVRFLRNMYLNLISLLPFRKKILSDFDFSNDEKMGINFDCIAFQKIADDNRSWDWNANF